MREVGPCVSPWVTLLGEFILGIGVVVALILTLSRGVIGNTSGFGPEIVESYSSETTLLIYP